MKIKWFQPCSLTKSLPDYGHSILSRVAVIITLRDLLKRKLEFLSAHSPIHCRIIHTCYTLNHAQESKSNYPQYNIMAWLGFVLQKNSVQPQDNSVFHLTQLISLCERLSLLNSLSPRPNIELHRPSHSSSFPFFQTVILSTNIPHQTMAVTYYNNQSILI